MSSLPPNSDPVVEAFVAEHFKHLNTNDAKIIGPDFTDDCYVVDAFAPFIWSGPSAITKWWSDLWETIKPFGLEKVAFTLSEFQRVFVVGDRAFVAMRASAIVSGPKFAVQPKGVLTLILIRQQGAWKIASWNWGGPPAEPIAQ